MTEQKKLDILACCFSKLDENRKDYILELSRKLADIHCGDDKDGISQKGHTVFANTHYRKGVLV